MRFAKQVSDDRTDAVIFLEDGGVVTMHHNGEHMLSEMYQDRAEIFDTEVVWEQLGEGKMYVKPWPKKQQVDFEMIENAIEWLCPFCENFIEVDFFNLVSEFNQKQQKKQADL